MSHNGKLQRGEVWEKFRDSDGNLPEEIENDKVKMEDVNYFLDNRSNETSPSEDEEAASDDESEQEEEEK